MQNKTHNKTEGLPGYFTDALCESVRVQSFAKGDWLFRCGEKVEGIYFVLEGEVKAVRHLANESEAVMMRARDGEFFAESAIAASHYSCDAIAVKPSRLAFVSQTSLNRALENPDFSKAFFLANAMNARRQCSRYERVRLRAAKDRVLHLLACESGPDGAFHWQAPLTELAVELALEPETLYRVLAELERAGTILRENRRLKLIS